MFMSFICTNGHENHNGVATETDPTFHAVATNERRGSEVHNYRGFCRFYSSSERKYQKLCLWTVCKLLSLPVCCASARSIRDIRWWGNVCDGVVGTAACVGQGLPPRRSGVGCFNTHLPENFRSVYWENPPLNSEQITTSSLPELGHKEKLEEYILNIIVSHILKTEWIFILQTEQEQIWELRYLNQPGNRKYK